MEQFPTSKALDEPKPVRQRAYTGPPLDKSPTELSNPVELKTGRSNAGRDLIDVFKSPVVKAFFDYKFLADLATESQPIGVPAAEWGAKLQEMGAAMSLAASFASWADFFANGNEAGEGKEIPIQERVGHRAYSGKTYGFSQRGFDSGGSLDKDDLLSDFYLALRTWVRLGDQTGMPCELSPGELEELPEKLSACIDIVAAARGRDDWDYDLLSRHSTLP